MRKLLSIVIPAFNEEENIVVLYKNICSIMNAENIEFECIIVDDCSYDNTFTVAKNIVKNDKRVSVIRLAKNYGAHIAIRCALSHCKGEIAISLAADLQDPPEIIPELYNAVKSGMDVVWAVRSDRKGESYITKLFSRIFYWIMRSIVKLPNQHPAGADFFCISRKVIDAVLLFREKNINIYALLCWIGFSQKQIEYVKQERLHGKSGWTLKKKIKLAVDSITSFSFLPVRLLSMFGIITALTGFLYAIYIILNSILKVIPVEGWASLMVVTLFLGGVTLIMLGILGEYLWRNLDEARARPLYIIDEVIDSSFENESKGNHYAD